MGWDVFFPSRRKKYITVNYIILQKKYIERIKHPNSPIVKKKWTPGRLRRFGEARQTRLSASQSLPASQPRTKLSLPIHPQLSSPPSPFSSPPNYISPSEKPLSHPLNPHHHVQKRSAAVWPRRRGCLCHRPHCYGESLAFSPGFRLQPRRPVVVHFHPPRPKPISIRVGPVSRYIARPPSPVKSRLNVPVLMLTNFCVPVGPRRRSRPPRWCFQAGPFLRC